MVELRKQEGIVALALEFCVLTAGRLGEVLGARWEEFELRAVPITTRDKGRESTITGPAWIIPGARMKAGRIHRVPGPVPRAVAILAALRDVSDGVFVFLGQKPGKPLSGRAAARLLERMDVDATAHGFRSAFRDWASEATDFSTDACEMALAHAISSKVEGAYRRGDLFEKRRELMRAWGDYCST